MTANAPGPDRLASDLEGLLGRELAQERPPRHAALRLHPTILPPPPDDDGHAGASHEDDIDLRLDDDGAALRRQIFLAAVGAAIAAAGLAGWLLFGRLEEAPHEPAELAPTIAAPPPAAPAPAAAAAPPASGDAAMGPLPTELIAPSTDGLSPARRVNAVRIVVEGDREVR